VAGRRTGVSFRWGSTDPVSATVASATKWIAAVDARAPPEHAVLARPQRSALYALMNMDWRNKNGGRAGSGRGTSGARASILSSPQVLALSKAVDEGVARIKQILSE
jgi:hypothetical protein